MVEKTFKPSLHQRLGSPLGCHRIQLALCLQDQECTLCHPNPQAVKQRLSLMRTCITHIEERYYYTFLALGSLIFLAGRRSQSE